jgi:hypothetical protein
VSVFSARIGWGEAYVSPKRPHAKLAFIFRNTTMHESLECVFLSWRIAQSPVTKEGGRKIDLEQATSSLM